MKMNTGVVTALISSGVVAAGTITAFTPFGKKVCKELAQSVRNVRTNLETKTNETEQPDE